MKHAKVGRYVQVLNDVDLKLNAPNTPVSKYQHGKIVTVTDQDTITVSVKGGTPLAAIRLTDPPMWRVNRFGAGS